MTSSITCVAHPGGMMDFRLTHPGGTRQYVCSKTIGKNDVVLVLADWCRDEFRAGRVPDITPAALQALESWPT